MKFILKSTLLMFVCFFLLIGCKTVETTDNSGQYAAKPTQAEIDNLIEQVINNETSELDENTKKLMLEIIKKAMESPETLTADLQKLTDEMLYAFPNPTSSSVTIEFARNFPFKSVDMEIKGGISLDLYYMGTKINTLEFSSVKDNKVVISSDYLQKEGTYTVFITGLDNVSTSFVVVKK